MSDCYEDDDSYASSDDSHALIELMDYAHYGEENPDQKEVDLIFEEACCDIESRCKGSGVACSC